MTSDGRDVRLADESGAAIPFVRVAGRDVEELPLQITPNQGHRGEQAIRLAGALRGLPVAAVRIKLRGGPCERTWRLEARDPRPGLPTVWLGGGIFSAQANGEHTLVAIPQGGTYQGPGVSDDAVWPDAEAVFAMGVPVAGDLVLTFDRGENLELDVCCGGRHPRLALVSEAQGSLRVFGS